MMVILSYCSIVYSYETADSFVFPLDNYVNDNCLDWGEYGYGQYAGQRHLADDRCVPESTDVRAIGHGRIKFTLDDPTGNTLYPRYWYGLIVMEHTMPNGNKVCSIYGHTKPVEVNIDDEFRKLQVGDEVIKGQKIGEIVNYPPSSEHIHFGIYNGDYVTEEGEGSTLGTWLFGYCLPLNFPGNYLDPIAFIQSHQAPPSFITWTRKADIPVATGGTPVAVNGKVYAFGGWESNLVYEYDPLSDIWTQKVLMPSARGGTVALPHDGKIYIAGGNPTPNGSLCLDVYDPETDLWQSRAPMPHYLWGGWGVAGGAVGDKLYVIGGYNWPNHEENYCREYDITADNWSLKTPMPTAVEWMNAAVFNDKIYVVAGQYGTGTHTLLDYIQIYNPSNDSWDIIPGLPIYLQGSGVIVYNNKLYIFGGNAGSPLFPILSSQKERNLTVYSYDFNSGVFTEEGDMPIEDGGQVCLIDNKIYLIGAGENRNETWEGLFFIHGEEIIHEEEMTIQQYEIIDIPIEIPDHCAQSTISRIIEGSDVEMSLIFPNEDVINRETIDPNVHHILTSGNIFEAYQITNPMPDEWTVRLEGTNVPDDGEAVSLTVSVDIISNQLPIADAGQDQTFEIGDNCLAVVMLDGSESHDPDQDELTYFWTWDGGSAIGMNPEIQLPLGVHTITLIVNDGTMDSNSDTVDIIVIDQTPPEITVTATPDILWPPNHEMIEINLTVEVSDNCDEYPNIVLTSVISNEPDNGKHDGNTINDIQNADVGTEDYNILLRAERSGKGDGRIYTITYTVIDASGNDSMASATVTAPHNKESRCKRTGIKK